MTAVNAIEIRDAGLGDFDFVADLMDSALAEYYGGDHRAHAKRIFDAHIEGGYDRIGFFSLLQKMFIVEIEGQRAGMLHLVLKRQGTCKISPLIVASEFRGAVGLGSALLNRAEEFCKEHACHQLYCTVSAANKGAVRFFMRHGFSVAGRSPGQYMDGLDELMLYRNVNELIDDEEFDLDHISVLELEERHKKQVRDMLLEELPSYFQGIDDSWIDALFAGHSRRHTLEVEQKYKFIFTATDRNDRVLGVAGATPKKGQPIKLMPFVAQDSPAFFALLSDIPGLLRPYGRKIYVHIQPSSEQVRFLHRAGWMLEALLPDAYKKERVTQQWGLRIDDEDFPPRLRLKKRFLGLMKSGQKTLEVRVGYPNIRSITVGMDVAFLSREDRLIRTVREIRLYDGISDALEVEDYRKIIPGFDEVQVERTLREIYPPEKEAFGVVVFDVGDGAV